MKECSRMFPLITKRLLLRYFHLNDLEQIHDQIFSDPEVMQFGDGPQTMQWASDWIESCIENYQTQGFGPYAVVERNTSKVIGYCGLFLFPNIDGQSEIEIGYRLARAKWGQGYATEAASVVRDFALNDLKLSRLVALIDPGNIASIHVAKKLGMHYEKEVMLEGYTHPDHLYVLNIDIDAKK